MNSLFLSGFGVSLNVDRASLVIKDGHLEPERNPSTYEVRPRHARFDSIVIDSQTGQISIPAMKWLMRHGIPLFILDYNGTLLSSVLPREPVVGNLKKAQVEAYQDIQRRFYIAHKIVEAKLERTRELIEWLSQRYDVDERSRIRLNAEIKRYDGCNNVKDLMFVEGRVAEVYWKIFQTLIPKKYSFVSRMHETHQMNSTDPVNTLLNYGYAFLESRCRASINTVGLEPSIGFLHEIAQPRYPLVYDLQEPFRWSVDKTVLSCVENDTFSKTDFFLTDNYVLRLSPAAIKRLLEELRACFNSGAVYKSKKCSWDTIIRLKIQELARYLLDRTEDFDLKDPHPDFREDGRELRQKLLTLTLSEARKLGLSKSTFWSLQNRCRSNIPLKIYLKTGKKISHRLDAKAC